MDDFNLSSLQESRNEWVMRLVNILYPSIHEGFKSLYIEAYKMCMENNEEEKYLMTFQNLISRIPKWNDEIINNEVKRISEKSSCGHIEDLITCVHIIQLKALTCVRVGQKQKKIEMNVPKLKDFFHKVYILVARKLYANIYLFEKNIPPLQVQKNNREIELIITECIINAVRDSIPIEHILRSYLEESIEEEEEIQPVVDLKDMDKPNIEEVVMSSTPSTSSTNVTSDITPTNVTPITTLAAATANADSIVDLNVDIMPVQKNETVLKFSDIDNSIDINNKEEEINAPKTIERLELLSTERNLARKLEEDEEEDFMSNDSKIKISCDYIDPIVLDELEIL